MGSALRLTPRDNEKPQLEGRRPIRDLARQGFVAIRSGSTQDQALRLMNGHQIRHLPVVDRGGFPIGILSRRDILSPPPPDGIPVLVDEIMARPVLTLPHDASLARAVVRMLDQDVRSVVLMENHNPVGIVTTTDILSEYVVHSPLADISLTEVAHSPVHRVRETASLAATARLLELEDIRHVVVVDHHERPIGMLTPMDLKNAVWVQAISEEGRIDIGDQVGAAMKSPVYTISASATAREAATTMLNRRIRGLPVVSDKRQVLGIVTDTDLIRRIIIEPL